MAARLNAIKVALTGDAAWAAAVTGGTFTWDDLGRTGLTPDVGAANGCYDANGKLETTAVLTLQGFSEADILKSESGFVRLWVYHDSAYANVRAALRAGKNLLDGLRVTADSEGTVLLRWVDDMPEFIADELGGALAGCSRYRILLRRQ